MKMQCYCGLNPLLTDSAFFATNQDCAVWRSFYRGVVLHGTSQTTVADTVAFDVTGSCFYLEDGVEEDNVIDHNLAAYVHVIGDPAAGFSQAGSTRVASADLANPIDAAAAGFYIPNTWNTITRNAASGGEPTTMHTTKFGITYCVYESMALKSLPCKHRRLGRIQYAKADSTSR
jgi:hypothetical protein